MKAVLVDTSIWSLALRRDKADKVVATLSELIDDSRVKMIGAIRQELLSGIKSPQQYELLKEHLRSFPDVTLQTADYEQAADFYNQFRTKGIQGSHVDFLICSVAVSYDFEIYTIDQDFIFYSNHLPIKLYK